MKYRYWIRWDNPTYVNGQAGSIYKQHIPLVNASLGPGQWQTYDIVFMAPLFGSDGRLTRPATFTVFHNGILIQNNVTVQGPTEFIGKPNYRTHGDLPLALQDHDSPVALSQYLATQIIETFPLIILS